LEAVPKLGVSILTDCAQKCYEQSIANGHSWKAAGERDVHFTHSPQTTGQVTRESFLEFIDAFSISPGGIRVGTTDIGAFNSFEQFDSRRARTDYNGGSGS